MITSKTGKAWTFIITILLAIIIAGSIVIWRGYTPGEPLEISLAPVPKFQGVISVGADNKFGHPTTEVMDRLIDGTGPQGIYRTDRHGSIEFITDGERLWVEVERHATPE